MLFKKLQFSTLVNLIWVFANLQALALGSIASIPVISSGLKSSAVQPMLYISGTITSSRFSNTAGVSIFFNGYSTTTNRQGHFQVKLDDFDGRRPLYILFGNATEWHFKGGTSTIDNMDQEKNKDYKLFRITIDSTLAEDKRISVVQEAQGTKPPFKDCLILPLKVAYLDLEAFGKASFRQAGSTLLLPISLSSSLDEVKFRQTADKTALFTLDWQAWHQASVPTTKFSSGLVQASSSREKRGTSLSNLSRSMFPG